MHSLVLYILNYHVNSVFGYLNYIMMYLPHPNTLHPQPKNPHDEQREADIQFQSLRTEPWEDSTGAGTPQGLSWNCCANLLPYTAGPQKLLQAIETTETAPKLCLFHMPSCF